MVLVEIILSFVNILSKLLLLELSIMRGGAEQVSSSIGDLSLVDLFGVMVEGGLGSICHHLGTGEEIFWGRLGPVGVRAGLVAVARAGIHCQLEWKRVKFFKLKKVGSGFVRVCSLGWEELYAVGEI